MMHLMQLARSLLIAIRLCVANFADATVATNPNMILIFILTPSPNAHLNPKLTRK